MKLLLQCLLIFAIPINTWSQCIANAGKDTTFCESNGYTITSTVTGGKAPYTYTWETLYNDLTGNYTASTFLDDTTLQKPKIKDLPPTIWQKFYLTVNDADGKVCKDSVLIRNSKFVSLLSTKVIYSNGKDSVTLTGENTVGGGIPPLTFIEIYPNEFISDKYNPYTKCKPPISKNYYSIYKDSVGCIDTSSVYEIRIDSTLSISHQHLHNAFSVYPNPANSSLFINSSGYDEIYFKLINQEGKQIHTGTVNNTAINIETIPAGIYLLTLYTNQQFLITKKISISR
jgi:hypothetical protein